MIPKHNGCFVDVGANTGYWTFPLARKSMIVHAFEPSPQAFRVLQKKARKYPNIHVYPYALGEGHYKAKLNLHKTSANDSLVNKAPDFSGKQVTTIVKSLDSFSFENVGLIKIDTEGYEIPVILGAKQTIQKRKPRLIIEVHAPFKEQKKKITTILRNLNYRWIAGYKTNLRGMRKLQPHLISDSN